MRQLFNTEDWNRGKITSPVSKYLFTQLDLEINRVEERIDQSRRRVNNTHLLLNLLLAINANPDRDTYSYLDRVIEQEVSVASKLGLATETRTAKLMHGIFFNDQADEIIYLSNDHFDPEWVIKNWRHVSPVRVQQHPFTDISFDVNDGNYVNLFNSGLCVTSINIRMLALQYQQWHKQERLLRNGGTKPPHEFIYQYPIKNMIKRTTNLAIQNRLFNIAKGSQSDNVDFIKIGIVATNDYTAKIDEMLTETYRRFGRNKYNFLDLCHNLPEFDGINTLRLPDTIFSTKLNWVNLVARLNLLEFLFGFYQRNSVNQKWAELLKREIKTFLDQAPLPVDFPYVYIEQIERLKEIVK